MTIQLLRKKFTVTDFQQMAELGIFQDNERVELIEGEIIEMGKIGTKHATAVRRLNDLFARKLGERALVDIQNPINLSSNSQPQPDVTILQRRPDYYESGHPQPGDILLLIEVSDSTLEYDQEIKMPLYGKSGIPEAWVININTPCLDVYRQPTLEGYQEQQRLYRGQHIYPLAFPDVAITVDELLG